MSAENVFWGAPRLHGELLKLRFAVAQSTSFSLIQINNWMYPLVTTTLRKIRGEKHVKEPFGR